MKLSEILDAIKNQNDAVTLFSNMMDPRTEASRGNSVRSAKQEIERLEIQYRKQISASVVSILATGGTPERQKEFQAAAEQKGGICVDADLLFKRVAVGARSYMGPNKDQLNTQAATYVTAQLSSIVSTYTPNAKFPTVPQRYLGAYLDDAQFIDAIRATAASTEGVPLNVPYAQDVVFQQALAQRVADEPIAIVVTGIVPTEAKYFEGYFFNRRPCVFVNLDAQDGVEELLGSAANAAMKKLGIKATAAPVQQNDLTATSDAASVPE